MRTIVDVLAPNQTILTLGVPIPHVIGSSTTFPMARKQAHMEQRHQTVV